MYVIAVTGRLASGKSTVSRLVAARGGYLIDADRIAGSLLLKGTPEYEKVVSLFGDHIRKDNGEIDREALAREVFSSKDKLQVLENIIHPSVKRKVEMELLEAQKANRKFAVIDLPLLKKSGLLEKIDYVILVTAPQDQIMERVTTDGMNYKNALERLKHQPSVEEIEQFSNFKIENNGNLDDLRKRIDELFQTELPNLM